jgi:hypothetical protein
MVWEMRVSVRVLATEIEPEGASASVVGLPTAQATPARALAAPISLRRKTRWARELVERSGMAHQPDQYRHDNVHRGRNLPRTPGHSTFR